MSTMPGPAMTGSNPALDQEIQKKATNAIIAAIVGFVCCPFVQIYTLMVANDALKQIKQTGAGRQHETLATIAKIVAIVHLCLLAAGIVMWLIMMMLGLGAAMVGGGN